MTRREKLREAYEDALFALLMEDVIKEEGQRLLEENKWLKNDPAVAVPEEFRQKMLSFIRQHFDNNRS